MQFESEGSFFGRMRNASPIGERDDTQLRAGPADNQPSLDLRRRCDNEQLVLPLDVDGRTV